MRHNNKTNSLGRKAGHRKAMMANMASSLIEHKRINTTVAKARALRRYVEPLITRSKTDSTHSRRVVFSYLQNKVAVSELFREVAPKIADRPGGYTRIIKTGSRKGDGAEMCMIELVDFNELYGQDAKKKTTRRRRRGGSASTAPKAEAQAETTEAAAPEAEAKVEEAPAAEAAPKAEAKADSDKGSEEKSKKEGDKE
ncbi:50S ribosomal protein L17 [bacterium SCSIO 12741]|nr:50S ribosomal protein L17 [bacterium SCSIO 12741]